MAIQQQNAIFWLSLILSLLTTVITSVSNAKVNVVHPITVVEGDEKELIQNLGEMLETDIEELCAKISDKGSIDDENLKMRQPCLLFAQLYQVTGNKEYAYRSARLLSRYARQIPRWPIYLTNPTPEEVGKGFPQEGPEFYDEWDAEGLWGEWIYLDLNEAVPLLEAYDLIYNSGEIQKLGKLEAIENMLYRHVEVQKRYGIATDFQNVDAHQMHVNGGAKVYHLAGG